MEKYNSCFHISRQRKIIANGNFEHKLSKWVSIDRCERKMVLESTRNLWILQLTSRHYIGRSPNVVLAMIYHDFNSSSGGDIFMPFFHLFQFYHAAFRPIIMITLLYIDSCWDAYRTSCCRCCWTEDASILSIWWYSKHIITYGKQWQTWKDSLQWTVG